VRADAERRHLRFFIWEGTNDGPAIARLTRSRGLCPRHTDWLLDADVTEYGNALGTATAMGYVVAALLPRLEAASRRASARSRRAKEPISAALDPAAPCPACDSGSRTDHLAQREMLTFLQEPAGREAYQASDGVCLPHLRELLRSSEDAEVSQYLLKEERTRWERLHAELQEYCRKHDYRFRHEPCGAERDSWRRAAWKLAGCTNPAGKAAEAARSGSAPEV
jgi:hypothetical protein